MIFVEGKNRLLYCNSVTFCKSDFSSTHVCLQLETGKRKPNVSFLAVMKLP